MNPISKKILQYKRSKREQKLNSDPNNKREIIVIKDSPNSWHMEWLDEYKKSSNFK
jgi:hypothetical protein